MNAVVIPPAFGLSPSESSELRLEVQRGDWVAGFERFIVKSPPERAINLRLLVPVRHAGWQALLDPVRRQQALVFDPGLGSAALALAPAMYKVTACFPSDAHRFCAERRFQHLGITNIQCVTETSAAKADALDLVVMYGDWPLDSPGSDLESLRDQIVSGGSLIMVLPGAAATAGRQLSQFRQIFPAVEAFRYNGPPLEANEIKSFGVSGEPLVRRVRSWLAHHRAPGFLLVARTAKQTKTLVSTCLRNVERAGDTHIVVDRTLYSYPAGFTVLGQTGKKDGMVMRIALDARSTVRYRTNHATLAVLGKMEETVRAAVPRPLDAGECEGREYFAETTVPGVPITSQMLASPSAADSVSASALAWISGLHRATSAPGTWHGMALREQVHKPIEVVAARLGFGAASEWAVLAESLAARIAHHSLPRVLAHGDYSVDNVLVHKRSRQALGVFDWDLSVAHSLPLLDPLYFLATLRRLRDRTTFGQAFREIILGRFTEQEAQDLRAYCAAMNIPSDIIRVSAVLTWVDHIARRTLYPEHYHFPHWSADMGSGAWEAAREVLSGKQA